jgi:hypothetical protein
VFRAFSGSIEADGWSEAQAIEALDREVRRVSAPPTKHVTEVEISREAANDVSRWEGSGVADASGRYARYSEIETLPAPTSSSRP